jgi:hypothetical protein
MTDKSAFSESEWHALSEAPLLITAAVFDLDDEGSERERPFHLEAG